MRHSIIFSKVYFKHFSGRDVYALSSYLAITPQRHFHRDILSFYKIKLALVAISRLFAFPFQGLITRYIF